MILTKHLPGTSSWKGKPERAGTRALPSRYSTSREESPGGCSVRLSDGVMRGLWQPPGAPDVKLGKRHRPLESKDGGAGLPRGVLL